ncbi:unnamed protein product [Acanthosepion pharaonis]|uniref:Uncharacterized protein n=1 Tax=Acanthosepion pharaonis TaxID=158019 RepID=A0A812BX83_ACAPH|nr:unnamed protein product [Sepia pharaonis]
MCIPTPLRLYYVLTTDFFSFSLSVCLSLCLSAFFLTFSPFSPHLYLSQILRSLSRFLFSISLSSLHSFPVSLNLHIFLSSRPFHYHETNYNFFLSFFSSLLFSSLLSFFSPFYIFLSSRPLQCLKTNYNFYSFFLSSLLFSSLLSFLSFTNLSSQYFSFFLSSPLFSFFFPYFIFQIFILSLTNFILFLFFKSFSFFIFQIFFLLFFASFSFVFTKIFFLFLRFSNQNFSSLLINFLFSLFRYIFPILQVFLSFYRSLFVFIDFSFFLQFIFLFIIFSSYFLILFLPIFLLFINFYLSSFFYKLCSFFSLFL